MVHIIIIINLKLNIYSVSIPIIYIIIVINLKKK